jgi:hypothetical protein
MPWLKELAQRERARQRKLHELVSSGDRGLKISPGRHCTWCPLLLNGCPVAETNPYGQMTPEQQLRFALWLQEAEKQNTKVLMVSGRLWDLLCATLLKRDASWSQSQLLGFVGRLQGLSSSVKAVLT